VDTAEDPDRVLVVAVAVGEVGALDKRQKRRAHVMPPMIVDSGNHLFDAPINSCDCQLLEAR
jgi:hypothetical protein